MISLVKAVQTLEEQNENLISVTFGFEHPPFIEVRDITYNDFFWRIASPQLGPSNNGSEVFFTMTKFPKGKDILIQSSTTTQANGAISLFKGWLEILKKFDRIELEQKKLQIRKCWEKEYFECFEKVDGVEFQSLLPESHQLEIVEYLIDVEKRLLLLEDKDEAHQKSTKPS